MLNDNHTATLVIRQRGCFRPGKKIVPLRFARDSEVIALRPYGDTDHVVAEMKAYAQELRPVDASGMPVPLEDIQIEVKRADGGRSLHRLVQGERGR